MTLLGKGLGGDAIIISYVELHFLGLGIPTPTRHYPSIKINASHSLFEESFSARRVGSGAWIARPFLIYLTVVPLLPQRYVLEILQGLVMKWGRISGQ